MLRCAVLICLVLLLFASLAVWAGDQSRGTDVAQLSVDSLLGVKISAAARYAQTVSEAPGSVTIITADDIERYGYHTLADALRSVPGFYTSYDRNYVYIGTRGFSRPSDYNNRILLLINDHVVNECVFGSAPFDNGLQIDLEVVERIEIVRGPGSALYGAGAMFAVVNVVTKAGGEVSEGRVSLSAASFDERGAAASLAGRISDNAEVALSATWQRIDGQDLYFPEYDSASTNHGVAEGLDWEDAYGIVATATFGDFSVLARHTWREKGIPTGAFEIRFNDAAARSLDTQSELEVRHERRLGATTSVMARAYVSRYGYRGTYPYHEDNFLESAEGRWAGGEVRGRWDLEANHRLTAGVEYRDHFEAKYRTWDSETVYFDGRFPFSILSGYVQHEYQASRRLTLTAGARYDIHSRFEDSFSPRLAVVFHPAEGSTLKLLYGHAFRAPNLYEAHFDDPGVQKPNPGLRPESIRTAEINFEHRLCRELIASVSIYRYTISRLIDPVIDPADDLLQYRNLSGAEATGLEVALTGRFVSGLHGYLSYSLQDATSDQGGESLTNSPRRLAKLGVSRTFGSGFRAAFEAMYGGPRITVLDTRTGGYPLTRLHLSWRSPHEGRSSQEQRVLDRLRLSVVVDNLLDRRYATPGGFEHLQDAIVQDGRRIQVRLDMHF